MRSVRLRRFTTDSVKPQPRLQNLFGTNMLSTTPSGLYVTKRLPKLYQLGDNTPLTTHSKQQVEFNYQSNNNNNGATNRVISYIKNYDPDIANDTLTPTSRKKKYKQSRVSRSARFDSKKHIMGVGRKSLFRGPKGDHSNLKHTDRAGELRDFRKVVKDRMFKPVEDILSSTFLNLYVNSPKLSVSTIPPRSSQLKSLVSQAANVVHSIDARKYPLYVSKTKYSHQEKSAKSVDTNQKISITTDDETDVEMVRVFSEKPNTIYGLVWDEFIGSISGNKLMFLSFDCEIGNSYSSRIKNDILNGRIRSFSSTVGSPDLRYGFSIHDEIIANVKRNMIQPLVAGWGGIYNNTTYGSYPRRR